MTPPPPLRRHRRAVRQLLLGLVPVLLVGVVVLVALALRLSDVQAPLAAADRAATATVTAAGTAPEGRGLDVSFRDDSGRERSGTLVLDEPLDVPVGAELTVQHPATAPAGDPVRVYTDGDAAHAAVGDVVFGLAAVVLVLLAVSTLTLARLLSRPRLRSRPATTVTATHVVGNQGLLMRSWLELESPAGRRWLPTHWAPELDRLPPGSRVEVCGDPDRGRLVLPVLDGAEVWPSGRLRSQEPRGGVRQAPVVPDAGEVGLARQARADGVLPFLAPVLGLLWAYVDGSGLAGFVVATALSAAVLFWVPQLLGSDPQATRQD
ncbi:MULTISPECIES: hypothetical protein [unclassified Modestobacter]|uniref:hypothetical protein n=1 Tax=unclassified Modestobacter TaxID=2643866 RepID=UPI0022AA81A7|nr:MULTISPECIES: hypothetical protein [unclassified Modestobacter]MCZ2825167.1 hypothetical protein [Modestobacter sp. VKM Ac-2981]MCZ2853768.1 hypothetical protein [Modestobacter sp. VKM Ac-2982]